MGKYRHGHTETKSKIGRDRETFGIGFQAVETPNKDL